MRGLEIGITLIQNSDLINQNVIKLSKLGFAWNFSINITSVAVKDGKNLVCTSSSKPNRELENLKRRRKKQRDNREVEGQGHIQDPAPGQGQGQDHVPDPDPGRGKDLETERKEGQEVDQGHLLLRREVAGGKVEGEAGQGIKKRMTLL